MNMDLTELVFILDRSGSMGGLESDTIGGFNGMIDRQKKEEKGVNVTTILFDDEVEVIHDRLDYLLRQWTMWQKVQMLLWQREALCRRLMSRRHTLHQI